MSHPSDIPTTPSTKPHQQDSELGLLDYLELFAKHRRTVLRITFAGCVLCVIVSLILPNKYASTAQILPPQQDSGLLGVLMMGSNSGMGLGSMAADLLGKANPVDRYESILNSEAIKDAIIDRFRLMDVYKQKYRLYTYKQVDKHVKIKAGKKDGIITITVEDKNPQRAADMANAFVEELDKLLTRINIGDASQDKAYVEQQLTKAKSDLARAEDNLKTFQAKNKTPDVVEQAKGTIKGVGDLEGQLAIEEVKLEGMRRSFTDSNEAVKNQQAIVASMKAHIAKFEGSRHAAAVPGVGSVPELAQQYLRLIREVKIQEAIVELLTKQSEISKLTAEKDYASIQFIQKARVADTKSKPIRWLIVLVGTIASGIIGMLYATFIESTAKMTEEQKERWRRLKMMLPTMPRWRLRMQ